MKKVLWPYSAEKPPEVGDVIVADKYFQFTCREKLGKIDVLNVDIRSAGTTKIILEDIPIEERLKVAAETGNPDPPATREVDICSYDPSRNESQFVIEFANLTQEPGSPEDLCQLEAVYTITARRLSKNGEYDPNGELLMCVFKENYHGYLNFCDVIKVGEMTKTFVKNDK